MEYNQQLKKFKILSQIRMPETPFAVRAQIRRNIFFMRKKVAMAVRQIDETPGVELKSAETYDQIFLL